MRVCRSIGSEIAHWLFWQKNTTGALLTRGEDERLVDVALAGRAVAEVGDDGGVALGVAGADRAVALDAHGVAGRVQRLGADDDRVEVEVLLVRVPAAVVDAAEEAEQVERVDAAAPGDAVLAVGREGVVLRRAARGRSRPGRPPGRAGWPRCRARPGAAARWPRRRRGGSGPGRGRSRAGPRRRGRRRTASYSGFSTRSPSGVSSWTSSGPPSPMVSGTGAVSAATAAGSRGPSTASSGIEATSLSLTGTPSRDPAQHGCPARLGLRLVAGGVSARGHEDTAVRRARVWRRSQA